MAIGVAEKEGLLNVQDPVSRYLPRFKEGPASDLTIEHVLQMRSAARRIVDSAPAESPDKTS